MSRAYLGVGRSPWRCRNFRGSLSYLGDLQGNTAERAQVSGDVIATLDRRLDDGACDEPVAAANLDAELS
jgi:hypothetical protein